MIRTHFILRVNNMSTNNKSLIYLQFSGSYYNSALESWGMPIMGISIEESTGSIWTSKKNTVLNFLNAKFETFNILISQNQSDWNTFSQSKKIGRVIFIPVKASASGDLSVLNFYRNLKRKLLLTQGYYNDLHALAFPGQKVAFVFIIDKDPHDGANVLDVANLQHYAGSVISQLLGLKTSDFGYRNGAPSSRKGWTAIHRKQAANFNLALYNQWYIGQQDAVKLIASKSGYVKPPTPQNIANKAQYSGGTIVLTKQRLLTRFKKENFDLLGAENENSTLNPGYLPSRDYVIKGMIGSPGDEDYIKILLDAGTYRIMQIFTPHSMLDLKLEFLNPMVEIPKKKNGLDSSSIKSECQNKIAEYPTLSVGSHECFGLDKALADNYGDGILADSSPSESPAAIDFKIKKRTFVYLRVSPTIDNFQGLNNNPADIGKYAIALINVDKNKVSNDLRYPSCYINWSLNPDPIAVPERKLSRIKILQNGQVKEVAFYLQEKDDTTKGALIIPKKFNTVVNGKLVESTSADGIKYIIDSNEFSLYGYTNNNNDRFRLFAPSLKKTGEFAQVEFIAGGVYDTDISQPFDATWDRGQFITDISDTSLLGNYTQPPQVAEEIPYTPYPTPTPTSCRVRECTGDQNDAPANCGTAGNGDGYVKDLSINCSTCMCTCKYRECTGNSNDPSMECWRYGFPGDYEPSCTQPGSSQGFCGCKKVSS